MATLQDEVDLKDYIIREQAKINQHLKAALTEMYECDKGDEYICSDSEPKISDPEPEVPDTEVVVSDPEAEVPVPEAEVPDHKVDVSDPEPEVSDPEVDVSDPEHEVPDPEVDVSDPKTEIPDPEVDVSDPEPEVPDPEVDVSDPETEIPDPEVDVSDPEVDVSDPEPKVSFKVLPQKMDMVATSQDEAADKDFMIQEQAKINHCLNFTDMYECNYHLKTQKYQVLDSEAEEYICLDSEPVVPDPDPCVVIIYVLCCVCLLISPLVSDTSWLSLVCVHALFIVLIVYLSLITLCIVCVSLSSRCQFVLVSPCL